MITFYVFENEDAFCTFMNHSVILKGTYRFCTNMVASIITPKLDLSPLIYLQNWLDIWILELSSPHLALGVVENEFPVAAETLAEISDILVRRRGKCLVHVDELQGKRGRNRSICNHYIGSYKGNRREGLALVSVSIVEHLAHIVKILWRF